MADVAEPQPSRKRLVTALAALWTLVVVLLATSSGCYGHNCEGDVVNFGSNPGEGHLIDTNTWASSPVDGVWLDFPRQRAWVFELEQLGRDRWPELVVPYVSAVAQPISPQGSNFTIAAGNLAEISGVGKGRVTIKNGTCADYFLRLMVVASPETPTTSQADAGTLLDGSSDAGAGP